MKYLIMHDPVVAAFVVVIPGLAALTVLAVGIAAAILHFQTRPGRNPGDVEQVVSPLDTAVPAGEPPALVGTAAGGRSRP